MAKTKTAAGLRYVGNEFLVGVPARDLTAEEAAEYAAQINENEAATGRALYVAAELTAVVTPVTGLAMEATEGGGNG
jgi:hypothetical protein